MRRILLLLCLFVVPVALTAAPVTVRVYEPYLELHTGPGRSYPVTIVVPRGEEVTILKRRTDWFKVRDSRGREGWANRDQMAETFTSEGTPLAVDEASRRHEREAGLLAGGFGAANVITAYGAYGFSPKLAGEIRLSQILGDSFDGQTLALGVTHGFRPDWRIQPFVSIGTGLSRIRPKVGGTLAPAQTDQLAYVGAGFRTRVSNRLLFRAEYNKYFVFTQHDDNQEANEWKLGFAFSF
jgi:hypothetical protein